LAVQRGLAFDICLVGWQGAPERIRTDSWLLGTGVSAPVTMLATQAVATARLARGQSPSAARVLGILGATMVGGYLVERETRIALSPHGWSPAVTPAAAFGLGLAIPMAGIGLRRHQRAKTE